MTAAQLLANIAANIQSLGTGSVTALKLRTVLNNFANSIATSVAGRTGDVTLSTADISGLGSLATQSGTFSGTSSGTNSGDQSSVSGNAGTATVLATARSISATGDGSWTVSFNGGANVTASFTLATVTFAKGGTNATTAAGAFDNLSVHGADIASAATLNLESATGNLVDVSGTTTVTAVTLAEGHERTVLFTGALILTHGSSLVLPGAANLTTAAGDFAIFRGYAAGVVRCVFFSAASGVGAGVVTLTGTQTLTNKTLNASSNTLSNLTTAMFAASIIDTDVTLAAASNTRLATQLAVKTYIDALLAAQDAMVFKGVLDCSASPNYPAADAGHTYRVSVAGKIGGGSGTNVEAGDLLLCLVDSTASGTQAGVGANWNISQSNIDGAVTGPASAASGNAASFSGTSGKLIADSGKAFPSGSIVGTTDSQALTNKSINGVTPSGSGTLANSGTSSLTGFTGSGTSSGTNSGDQTAVSGNAGTATTLATARSITATGDGSWSVSFNGGANVTAAFTLATVTIAKGGTNATTAIGGFDNLSVRGADIASAATINLTAATGNLVDVTGTTTVTAVTLADGLERTVRFTGALTLTHGASLALPGAANITTASGDFALFRGYAAGVVRCFSYTIAANAPGGGGSVTASSSTTFTNKRTTKRVATLTDAATVTIDSDSYDGGLLASLSQTTTFASPSGTPTDFQQYVLRIKSTTARTINWNSAFRGSVDQALPSATSGSSLTDFFIFQWNAADSKWDMLAKNFGF